MLKNNLQKPLINFTNQTNMQNQIKMYPKFIVVQRTQGDDKEHRIFSSYNYSEAQKMRDFSAKTCTEDQFYIIRK